MISLASWHMAKQAVQGMVCTMQSVLACGGTRGAGQALMGVGVSWAEACLNRTGASWLASRLGDQVESSGIGPALRNNAPKA